MIPTTLEGWLAWIERQNPREIELGLARVRSVAERLGLIPPPYRVITVAGTNGKGSTVALTERILRAAGYRTGAYFSPHLVRYNERVWIDGSMVTDDDLCGAFARVEAARGEVPLTYFEFGTLCALELFQSRRIEVAILEVGLGGRLDAVNVVDADCAIVTAVGTDHRDWLGPDREAIGREKAGVFRANRPAVCSDPSPPASIAQTAAAIGARLLQLGRDFSHERQTGGWTWRHGTDVRAALPYPALRGDYQLDNAAGALMALNALADVLPVAQADIRAGLLDATLPGRFQTLPGLPLRVLDVAHNVEAAHAFAATLARQPVAGRTLAVVGMLKDKPITETLRVVAPRIDAWYLADLSETPRGTSAAELQVKLEEAGVISSVSLYPDPITAYGAAMDAATTQDRVVIFGSFHTVGAILRLLQNPANNAHAR